MDLQLQNAVDQILLNAKSVRCMLIADRSGTASTSIDLSSTLLNFVF
jgi:hypothetical protein